MHLEELSESITKLKQDMRHARANLGDTEQSSSSASSNYGEYKPGDVWKGPKKPSHALSGSARTRSIGEATSSPVPLVSVGNTMHDTRASRLGGGGGPI